MAGPPATPQAQHADPAVDPSSHMPLPSRPSWLVARPMQLSGELGPERRGAPHTGPTQRREWADWSKDSRALSHTPSDSMLTSEAYLLRSCPGSS